MELQLILAIIIGHWIGDYVLQTEAMAVNKSKSNKWLTIHVGAWTFGLAVVVIPFSGLVSIWLWVLLMGVLHWIQDYITSRINTYFLKKKWQKLFWLSIGTDQMLHYLIMFYTINLWVA
jgi:hypothetical protein